VIHRPFTGIDVQVYPQLPSVWEAIPGGTALLIPKLVGGTRLLIQYVGVGVTTSDIMLRCESDEGGAKMLKVLPMRVYPPGVRYAVVALMGVGAFTVLYGLVKLAIHFWR
jgi:hypothetical protein